MVSRDKAIQDGRPVVRKGEAVHFHDLGMEKMTDAVMALENPIMTISTKTPEGNPAVIMILPVNGKNKTPLYAVLSFYSNRPINGDLSKKPRIVLTIAEREFFGSKNRSGYAEIVRDAVKDGRVIDFNKEMRDELSVIANPAGVGNITDSSLADNLARFLKEIKSFKEKNRISYKTPKSGGMSSRQLLADAFDELVQTPKERELMDQYRANISKVEEVQGRLQKVRGKIRELTKSKGDKAKIAALNKTAAELADLIDKYDRKLLEMEASKPLRDVLARAKSAAYKEAKKRSEETMKEYRQQVSDRFDRGVDSRRKTEMRHKIQNVVKELNDLLLNESKKRHVPDNLKKAVAGALSIVNMDTVDAGERAAKYAALIAKEQAKANPDQDKIDSYTMTMENILRQGEKMGKKLKDLRDAYEEIQESDDPDIANAYDPVIAGAMKELSQTIGDTSIRNMSLDQLSDVYDMYRMVLTRVRDAKAINYTLPNGRVFFAFSVHIHCAFLD